jgi:hypothetical protein
MPDVSSWKFRFIRFEIFTFYGIYNDAVSNLGYLAYGENREKSI